jgi:hemerythrin-like domain-containing protein
MTTQLFELLKRDHRQVEKWLTQIENGAEKQREEVFTTLQDALEKHMQMEEKLFYPQLKKISELKTLAADAVEEHETAKNLLSQLEEQDVEDKQWITDFQELSEGLQHHIQDEEQKIFPACTKYMPEQLLREIGQKCTDEKERTQTSRSSSTKPQKK